MTDPDDNSDADLRQLIELVRGITYRFYRTPEGEYGFREMSASVNELVGEPAGVDLTVMSAWIERVPACHVDAFIDSIEQSWEHLTTWTHEWPIDTDRGRIWLQGISRPHREDNGNVVWNGLVFDITDRHVIAERLDQAETDYHSVFENTNEGIFRVTPDGRLLDANPALQRMHRCSKQELLEAVQDTATDWYVNPADRRRATAILERDGAIDAFQAEIYRVGTGERFIAEENATAIRDANGNTLYYQGTIQDITDQYRRRQRNQRRSEILEWIARGEPLTEIVYETVAALEDFGPRISAGVFRVEGGRLHVIAAPGIHDDCIEAIQHRAPRRVGGAIAGATQSGRLTWQSCEVRSTRSLLGRAMEHAGYGDLAALPVRDRSGDVLGFLIAFTRYREELDEELSQLLFEMSQILSIALEQDLLTRNLVEQAQYDSLTQLPNRVLLADRVQQLIHEAERDGNAVGMLLLDLDEFKLINDTLGHPAGDELLRQVARRLEECVRSSDTVARFGGDEFVVVVPIASSELVSDVADRIITALATNFHIDGNDVAARPSIGISLYPQDGESLDSLLQAADTAMYAAKEAGKNQYHYFNEAMNFAVSERLRIEGELRDALVRDELDIWYQPRVGLDDRGVRAAEALVRWHHPTRGLLLPNAFLDVAERSDLINDIDAHNLHRILACVRDWRGRGRYMPVAINLSVRELQRPDFARDMAQILGDLGQVPHAIELEITEGMAMKHFDQVVRQLDALRERAPGVRIALDDFGSGYSSLQHLSRLPIDILKLDRAFVSVLDAAGSKYGRARAIARTIIELGQNLELLVVAEGVETEAQAAILRELECPEAQGFLFARPMPVQEFDEWFGGTRVGAGPAVG